MTYDELTTEWDRVKELEGTDGPDCGAIHDPKLALHTDRSRIVTTRRCKRARFWGYEVTVPENIPGVLGISPARTSIPMLIGSAVHQGLELLHKRLLLTGGTADETTREEAVEVGLEYYNTRVEAEALELQAGLSLAEDEWMDAPVGLEEVGKSRDFEIKEGRALVEALIRAYYMVGLSQLWDRYEILTVEEEVSGVIIAVLDAEIQLNGRADAVLRDRATGGLFAFSIKTAKDLDSRASYNWREDDQGISECFLIQQQVLDDRFAEFGINSGDQPQLGVQMLHLLKGNKYKDQNDGIWKHSSPLVRPFTQEGPMGDLEFRPKWNWVDDTGKNRVLGKGWRATPIWETSRGIQDWLDELFNNYEGVLEGLVVLSEGLVRSPEEIHNWTLEAGLQELGVLTTREVGNSPAAQQGKLNLEIFMAGEFPKNRSACNYPTACEFKPLCHPVVGTLGMSEVGEVLVKGGLVQIQGFKARVPNHPQEQEQKVEKGA